MERQSLIVACILVSSPAVADQLPGTLNFRDVTSQNIVPFAETAQNEKEVEYGDFDNDGDLDVVIANAQGDFSQRTNKLYRNDGGVFTEISGAPAIPGFSDTDVSRNAFFRDYDGDDWLDIIIVNDHNSGGQAGRTKIYMNQHPGDVFSSFTEEGEVRLGSGTGGAACGAVSIDADNDNDFDLYVGNYPGPSQDTLYFNDGAGFFTEMTSTNVPIDGDYTVDVASADLNGDGKLEVIISNHTINFAYYNDNLGAGSGIGDYSYTGSTQSVGNASSNENAMEPGDFDGDNDPDVYWSNYFTTTDDRILRNDGTDANNKATFTVVDTLVHSVTDRISRKASVADLNNDGRDDIFVMKSVSNGDRPTVLRNTSVNGVISFVDWTPASAFPSGSAHEGWHAALFDADGDGRRDIFLGGWTGDHLFLSVPGGEMVEGDLVGGALPLIFDKRSKAVVGAAGPGTPDVYTANDIGADARVSVVLNGADDYVLEILDSGDNVLATSDRGGAGIEEARYYQPPATPGTLKFRVSVTECATPSNVVGDCSVNVEDLLSLLGAWGPNPGHPADLNLDGNVDVLDLLDVLAAWGASEYIIEFVARAG